AAGRRGGHRRGGGRAGARPGPGTKGTLRMPGRLPPALRMAPLLRGAPTPAMARQPPAVSLLLSYRPADPAPKAPGEDPRANYLRPNVAQELFVHVRNDDNAPRQVTVQVVAGGAVVAAKPVKVAAGKTQEVAWARPVVPPGAR